MRVGLVLGYERRCRDVRDHEAGLQPRFTGEEHVEVGIDAAIQQVDASFRDARRLRDGDRQEIADEAHGLGMEVSAGQDVLTKDQRIVGNTVDRG